MMTMGEFVARKNRINSALVAGMFWILENIDQIIGGLYAIGFVPLLRSSPSRNVLGAEFPVIKARYKAFNRVTNNRDRMVA